MWRRRQERAALRELQRRVWGDQSYEAHVVERARERQRRVSIAAVVVGVQMLVGAFALLVFANPASAHDSQITIGCTQVEFNYTSFPETAVTAHESIVIDGSQGPQRDFQFTGPAAIDIISITLSSGTHTVTATTNWTFFGEPQGSGSLTQQLSDCTPATTTTTSTTSTTTAPSTSTTTSTTVPPSTTTTAPASTTTSSMISGTTTSTVGPEGSTTTLPATTTSEPVVPQGSTTTFAPIPPSPLPFTGSSNRPLSFGLGAIGLGAIACGIAALRRGGRAG